MSSMITKKLGIIGCGNMGGAILYGALESGVIDKSKVYVYDILPAMREKAAGWGVNVTESDAEVCRNSDIILLAVKPQNAEEALAMCEDALDGKGMMSIVAGVTAKRLQAMVQGTPCVLCRTHRPWSTKALLPCAPTMISQKRS